MKSAVRQAARRRSRVGPWLREDYRSVKRLCTAALSFEPLDWEGPPRGLMDAIAQENRDRALRRSPYPDFDTAQRALRAHRVFCWLKEHIPLAVESAGDPTPFVQFRRVRVVVEHLPNFRPPAKPVRLDKARKPAARAVERLQKCIDNGALWFPNPTREQVFEELLEEAGQILRTPRRQRSVGYPSLEWLARALWEQVGTAVPQLLLQVAAACDLQCDERTVQAYAQNAGQSTIAK